MPTATSRVRLGALGLIIVTAACGGGPATPPPAAAPAPASAPAQASTSGPFDVVIAGGRVVDGTGAPWFIADVGIAGDKIVALGNLSKAQATTRVDAAGMVVAPGFIDLLGQSEFNV